MTKERAVDAPTSWLLDAIRLKDLAWITRFFQFGIRVPPAEAEKALISDSAYSDYQSVYKIIALFASNGQSILGPITYANLAIYELLNSTVRTVNEFHEVHRGPAEILKPISQTDFPKFSSELLLEEIRALYRIDDANKYGVLLAASRPLLMFEQVKNPRAFVDFYINAFKNSLQYSALHCFVENLEFLDKLEVNEKRSVAVKIFAYMLEDAKPAYVSAFLVYAVDHLDLDEISNQLEDQHLLKKIPDITEAIISYRLRTDADTNTEHRLLQLSMHSETHESLSYFLKYCLEANILPKGLTLPENQSLLEYTQNLEMTLPNAYHPVKKTVTKREPKKSRPIDQL